jgi:hypothetical protein
MEAGASVRAVAAEAAEAGRVTTPPADKAEEATDEAGPVTADETPAADEARGAAADDDSPVTMLTERVETGIGVGMTSEVDDIISGMVALADELPGKEGVEESAEAGIGREVMRCKRTEEVLAADGLSAGLDDGEERDGHVAGRRAVGDGAVVDKAVLEDGVHLLDARGADGRREGLVVAERRRVGEVGEVERAVGGRRVEGREVRGKRDVAGEEALRGEGKTSAGGRESAVQDVSEPTYSEERNGNVLAGDGLERAHERGQAEVERGLVRGGTAVEHGRRGDR